ncbi:MAG: RNA methyltransferase [Candidatus Omnitrophica bacterium]|nr:RNA methyltransferase [Candidatus Omnitrophota bacterium]
MFLYGKNSVFERLKINPESIEKIFLEESFSTPHIEELIKSAKITAKRVSKKELLRIKHADSLQGIVASVAKFEYADLEDLLNKPKNEALSLIFLDRVFDPQNLGAMIRTTACFGKFALVIPSHKACEVTEVVLHVASGGENYTPVAMVSNLTNALLAAKKKGWWVVGAVTNGGEDIGSLNLPFPLCFVLGSEGKGIRYGIEKYLDIKTHIPMSGAPLSFNVATSCAIFCYQISLSR